MLENRKTLYEKQEDEEGKVSSVKPDTTPGSEREGFGINTLHHSSSSNSQVCQRDNDPGEVCSSTAD